MERDRWRANDRMRDRTLAHWRDAADIQGPAFSPVGISRQVRVLFNSNSPVTLALLVRALISTHEYRQNPGPSWSRHPIASCPVRTAPSRL